MKKNYLKISSKGVLFFTMMASALWMGSPHKMQAQAKTTQSMTQTTTIKGQIVDMNNEPIIGANVVLKGTTNGVITDIDGNFTLSGAKGTLVVSYIGYKTQEVSIAGKQSIRITLVEDTELLGEVIVVGYGAQKKATLTGAVTVVSDKMLGNKGSMSSPLQAIQGQVPGVSITRNSSAPGDESWGMKLRGAVSANNADPLIVIDGVAYDGVNALRNINPSDIQSMNFLKDASAAIYGSRAAGGVVLITTKQAKEGVTKVEYNGSYTHKMVGLQPQLMSMEEWAHALIQARTNDGYTDSDTWMQYAKLSLANKGGYIDLKNSGNPFTSAFTDVQDFVFHDTNWSDILFGDAGSTTHDLAISGGTNKALYRLSIGYLYDDSNLKWGNNNNNRYNIRLTNKFNPFKRLSIESAIAYNRQDQVAPSLLGNSLTSSYPQPGLPAATADGRPYSWGTWMSPNWYAELGGDNRLKVSEVNISEKITYNITNDLDAVVNVGYNSSSATRDTKKLAITSFNYAGTSVNSGPTVSDPTKSSYDKTSSRTDFYSASGYLNYTKTLGKHHNLGIMLGTQYELKEYDYFGASVQNIQGALDVINGAGLVSLKDGRGSKWQEAVMSYYSRLNYNFRERYLFEVNLRYDGSSKFQPQNRWDFFYGVSGGWRVSEESFMKNAEWLNDLKIRVSYGEVGNQGGIARYDGSQFYKFESQTGALLGSSKSTIINTNGEIASIGREWERIKNSNIGIDFTVLNSRLSGTAELFMKRNDNMLIDVTYPGVLGDKAGKSNSGAFEAYGWEGILNWSDKIDQVTYRIGGTFSYVDNKLTNIGGTSVLRQGFIDKQQGYPLNSIFGLRYAGKVQNEEQRQKYLYRFLSSNTIGLTNELRLGDNMFADSNNDGRLDQNDIVYLGSDDPKVNYSVNLGVEWNGFDLSVIFQGVGQRTIFRSGGGDKNDSNETWRVPMRSAYLNTSNQSVDNVWSLETPNNHYPTYTNKSTLNNYNYQSSSWSVENGAYFRLKNVTLGYNFPSAVLKRTKSISACRIYLTGADLWEVSKITDGWDPESSRKVQDAGRFPFVRTVTCGLNLTF